ncbi:ABC transporter substrate-binding protein [Afifella sp. IM 167]|uniref:ABC transporter substrate-binding protein n=1 Tax=Afifella sp. IM 167 TaxID=2033586 RepID=UPI001CC97845|nr:ABC transporter substrate-binding protein [Afifella sp. IM 167]MBZ8133736.1 hypothetical protein [Afifella sp. IM 167]
MRKTAGMAITFAATLLMAGSALAQDTITVGMAGGVNQVPSLVAADQGFFKEEGLNVDIKPVPRGNIAIEAIIAGSMQFAEVSEVALLSAVDKGIPLLAVAAASRGFTGKMVGANDLGEVKDIADLKGKRIGIQVGTGVHGVFLMLLKKKGLSQDDFNIANVRVNDMPTAMSSPGTFDAVFGWDPMMQRTVQAGYGKEVISADQFQKMAGITYPLVLVADKAWVEKNRETVQHFVNAYAKAQKWIRENPEKALDLYAGYIEKAGAPLDKEIVRNMMFEVDKFPGVEFIDSDWSELADTRDFLKENGQISTSPDIKAITDTSFGDKAEASLK